MRRFKRIEWNLMKIAAHHLSPEEVEAVFDGIITLDERPDATFKMFAEIPSGRRIGVIWRYDREDDPLDVFAGLDAGPIFVITAY